MAGDIHPCSACGKYHWGVPCQFAPTHYTQPMVYNMTVLPLLTKRELFAAMAMQGLLSNRDISGTTAGQAASAAVANADALLAELEKGEKP